MLSFNVSGSFDKTTKFLRSIANKEHLAGLEHFGQMGVNALAAATPVESGLTARSWRYRIIRRGGRHSIEWYNTNEVDGTPVVIWLQYGHGTGTGGWVQGRDFINPAIQPIFDKIANEVWERVRRA